MGLGMSIFLGAVGAVLRFAVTVQTTGFNVHTIGVILMIVGVIGAVASMMFWSTWGGFNRTGTAAGTSGNNVVIEHTTRPRAVVTERVATEREVR